MNAIAPIRQQHLDDQGASTLHLDTLQGYIRSALHMARVLLEEVLDSKFSLDEPEEYLQLATKAGGELAMLLRLAVRARARADHDAEIDELAYAVVPLARAPRVYRSLLMRPSRASMYTLAHFCLVELGLPDDRFDRVARLALHSSVSAANERVPYRMLDAAWTRHLAFGVGELDHPAMRLSPLGVGVDLLEASVDDAYAFTHALAYATDFGRIPLPGDIDRRSLLGVAEALAVKALDEDDLDLLAEVLMAPAILRLSWTPTLSFAWNVLERVWIEFGFVPGPGLPPPVADENRAQTARRVLGTVYHTTFAAGLCCATLVACNAPPPHLEHAAPGRIAAPPGNGKAWKINWSGSSQKTQERLNFLCLAFELRRGVDASDFVQIHAVLMSAVRDGLAQHPLFTQGLELLERVRA